jgi:hypothetical protein
MDSEKAHNSHHSKGSLWCKSKGYATWLEARSQLGQSIVELIVALALLLTFFLWFGDLARDAGHTLSRHQIMKEDK